jgi:hypothetical protein
MKYFPSKNQANIKPIANNDINTKIKSIMANNIVFSFLVFIFLFFETDSR